MRHSLSNLGGPSSLPCKTCDAHCVEYPPRDVRPLPHPALRATLSQGERVRQSPSPPGRGVGEPPNAANGFTLLELILVLVIISIAFALVAPAVGNRLGGSDPKRTAAQLRTTLELLRLRALTDGIEQRLVIDPEDNQYWQESGRQVAVRDADDEESDHEDEQLTSSDEDIQLSATSLWVREEGEVEFRFYPDGTNSGGEIIVEQQRGAKATAYIIALNPLLGTATVRYAGEESG